MTDTNIEVKPKHYLDRRKRKKPSKLLFNKKKKEKFLELLRNTCNLSGSARAVGVGVSTIYEHKNLDPEFKRLVEEAQEEAYDNLEGAGYDRALNGVDKGVYYRGELVATEKDYSDALLMFMLKANRAKYRDQSKVELTGKDGGPVEISEAKSKLLSLLGVTLDGECEVIEEGN